MRSRPCRPARTRRCCPSGCRPRSASWPGAAKEGLLALSVGVGLGVLAELMEEEVTDVVGSKGEHDPERTAVRHGHEAGEVTLGGRRVAVERPRARTADGESEVALETYRHFADRDPLTRLVLEQMVAGVSTRRFERTREPVGAEVEAGARSVSRSAVSREFVARTRANLDALMSRRLDDVRLGVRCVLEGARALRRAVREVLGAHTPVQRCVRHKQRNVLDHLPERDRPAIKRRLRHTWADTDHGRALDALRVLAAELDRPHPGAAA